MKIDPVKTVLAAEFKAKPLMVNPSHDGIKEVFVCIDVVVGAKRNKLTNIE